MIGLDEMSVRDPDLLIGAVGTSMQTHLDMYCNRAGVRSQRSDRGRHLLCVLEIVDHSADLCDLIEFTCFTVMYY